MHDTRLIMGMPVSIHLPEGDAARADSDEVFSYFEAVDRRFSTYRHDSEISRLNRGELGTEELSEEMREVLAIAERTKETSAGYFDIRRPDGSIDPSGIVKGWAVLNAAKILHAAGYADFYIDGGGDIASSGTNAQGRPWSVGIENPFDRRSIVKVVRPYGRGIATSGSYIRGAHIYDPHTGAVPRGLVSITVIGPDVLEADRFATAAFAMGKKGIEFIARKAGFEAYAIDEGGIATMTSGFDALVPA